ncbi:MAG: 7TM diverse intracellular signaling domain-containing protein [Niabella sp.]
MDKLIVSFYYFFHGILLFQVTIFLYLYFATKKKELLFFGLFLLLLGINFILNSIELYGLGDHKQFMYSPVYNFVNTPLVIVANICYISFLNAFYKGITKSKIFFSILSITRGVLLGALILFVVLYFFGIISNLLFNILHTTGIVVGIWLAIIIYKNKLPFKKYMINAFVSNLAGTFITVMLLLLQNSTTQHILVRQYPYIFIQIGLLFEIFFFMLAMLSKWIQIEKEAAIIRVKSELAVEKLRNQLSMELHDSIGSEVSGIALYSHLTKTQLESQDFTGVEKSLTVMQHSSAQMVNRLNDMIWLMKAEEHSVSELNMKLEEYILNMAAAKNMQARFINNMQSDHSLTFEQRHNIYLFCKEAINNAVKYSEGSQIHFTINQADKYIEYIISDNGKGFDVSQTAAGNGLKNMQQRTADIGADCSIQSSPGKGCTVALLIRQVSS